MGKGLGRSGRTLTNRVATQIEGRVFKLVLRSQPSRKSGITVKLGTPLRHNPFTGSDLILSVYILSAVFADAIIWHHPQLGTTSVAQRR